LYAAFPANGHVSKITRSGSIAWTGSLPHAGDYTGFSVAVDDAADRVYVTSYNNDVGEIGLSAFTQAGSRLWTKRDSTSPTTAASVYPNIQWVPVVMDDASIIVPWENDLHKFDASGNQVWEVGLSTWVRGAPAATAVGGFVAAGGQDGNLYAVETEAAPQYSLADANARPWDYSKYRHNSGAFTDATLLLSDRLGIRGTGAASGDQAVVYAAAYAVSDTSHGADDRVVVSGTDTAQ
jgi:hypothetical protein